MVQTIHFLASLVTIAALAHTVAARPAVFVPNAKYANKLAALAPSSSPSPSADFWVSTSPNFYVPTAPQIALQGQPGAQPVSAPSPQPTTTPAATLVAPTNLPVPLTIAFSSASNVTLTATSAPTPILESWTSRLLKRFVNVASLQAEILAYRVENNIVPTPWTPGQLRRASLASKRSSTKTATKTKTTTTKKPTSTTSKKPVTSTTHKVVTTTSTTKAKTTTTTTQKATTSKKTTTTSKPKTTTTTTAAKPTKTTSSGGGRTDGSTFWKQKSAFYSLESFTTDVVTNQHYSWGADNIAVLQGVPAHEWTNGKQGDQLSALQVAYPANSRNPGNKPIGGVGFYSSKIDVTAATNVSLSYSIFFPKGFDFVKGGKLPGLFGGAKACSGGAAAENCFSTRLMFRKNGMGELYLYAPREKQTEALCTLGPLSYCNSVYGMSIGRGSWTFKTGEWTDLRQDIWLNTPGVADGGFNIWVNGKLVLHSDSVYYRNTQPIKLGNGTAAGNIPDLIDYDSLPDDLIIPNGGFNKNPLETVSNATATTSDAYALPTDPVVPVKRRSVVTLEDPQDKIFGGKGGRKFVSKVPMDKRGVTLPAGFMGAMAQTFFGGSSNDFNTPILQHTYFRRFELAIN
ncbi:uncharacterized protein JCM15063_002155 [Sporobolomyces koalae]|uniref:uncharacterized protein n=1 Tax=Sporobolomyces koalae TaxID=500713 RepID=UPI003176BD73